MLTQSLSGLEWSSTGSIEIQESGRINGNESNCGDYHFELLSRKVGDNMYQVVETNPGSTLYISYFHKKRRSDQATDKMELRLGDATGFTMYSDLTEVRPHSVEFAEGWVEVTETYVVPPGQTQTVVMFRGLDGTSPSIGNLIDDVYIGCELRDFTCEGDENVREDELAPSNDIISEFILDESRVALYPVPASTNLSIKVTNSGKEVMGVYYIMSMNGRIVLEKPIDIIDGESAVIVENVSLLDDGVYFFVMEVNGRRIMKQFVKVSN